jgi:hypothetical protein
MGQREQFEEEMNERRDAALVVSGAIVVLSALAFSLSNFVKNPETKNAPICRLAESTHRLFVKKSTPNLPAQPKDPVNIPTSGTIARISP